MNAAIEEKAIIGSLACLRVNALVDDCLEPLTDLVIDVRQILKTSNGPEVLTNVSNAAALHLSFSQGEATWQSRG